MESWTLICLDFFVFNQVIKKFRDEELEHHDIGLEHDAQLVGDLPLLFACATLSALFGRLRGVKIFVSRKIDLIVTTKESKPIPLL